MRASLLIVLALGVGGAALAHDVWVQPASFNVAVGVPVPVTVLVGHGTFRQRWGVPNDRVLRFQDISAAGSIDRRTAINPDRGASDAVLSFTGVGTHMLVLESSHAGSVLPSIRFNDYLKVEGLTPAIAARARLGQNDKDGRETYSRRAKALVQVGTVTGDQAFVTRPVGLSLEIVPQKSPYALATGEALPVQILYEGKPLAGATVKLNNLDFDMRPIAAKLSDAAGRTSFDVPRRGKWQLNVIWTKPVTGNPAADFDTTFSSLTFGYAP
jgi:uncharacterized GH25 family protein